MSYDYVCPHCETKEEIHKSFKEATKPEYCKKCKTEMERRYGVLCIVTGDGNK